MTSACGCASSTDFFVGEWGWNNSPDTMTFSIEIKQQGKNLQGQYCAVAQNGRKMDCDDATNPNIDGVIDGTAKSANVIFSSFFGAKNGKAVMKISDGHLIWHIVRNPSEGEFYAPKNAILAPHQFTRENTQ
ncbi:hypothetical protein ACV22V_06900 [Burkholderia sp. AW33-5]